MSRSGTSNDLFDGTDIVDGAQLWESTFWVVLGALVYWVGGRLATEIAPRGHPLPDLVSTVVVVVAVVVAVFFGLKGFALLLEAVCDEPPT